MTDLDVVIQRLDTMQTTLADHGSTLKDLSKAMTAMAVQQEQITGLQAQCSTIWRKIDGLTGPDGPVTKIQEHQRGCPKEEMHRTFRWMWGVIGFQLVIIGWLIVKVV